MNMNTSSQKPRHGFRAWLCFFIGLNIIFSLLAASVILIKTSYYQLDYLDEYYDMVVRKDLKDTLIFKSIVAQHTTYLLNISKTTNPASTSSYSQLENELTNIACFVQNKDGVVIYDSLPDYKSGYVMDLKYDYIILIQDGTLTLHRSQDDDILRKYMEGNIREYEVPLDNSYAQIKRNFDNFIEENEYGDEVTVLYAVSSDPANFSNSVLYLLKQMRLWIRIGVATVFAVVIAAIILLIYSSVKREDKRHFFRKYASLVSRIWLEVKLALIAGVTLALFLLSTEIIYYYYSFSYSELALSSAIFIGCFWFYYLIIKDLLYNKSEFFKQNSIRTLIRVIRQLSGRLPFERRMIVGFWLLVAAELILVFLFFITLGGSLAPAFFFLIGIMLFVAAAIMYHKFVTDTGKLVSQIDRIKSGDLETRLELSRNSDLQEYANSLNSIQSGMSRALEEQLASERLKVDLITNVSHDLKTPLTSIIGYIDLLKKEQLPEQAVEYVNILSEKAYRLRTMIQDIFTVSKASSGNLDVNIDLLDLGKLVEQTLADMEERIGTSGLKFRVQHNDGPLYIRSDGQKLYRVMQNLIDNALCYSLEGSRVHIRLWSEKDKAIVEIKNTSKSELDFLPDDIVERFVRGDKSRSGDGSGLGLSIAKTFTEACGGSFRISIEYDDFKVRLTFPLESKAYGSDTDNTDTQVGNEAAHLNTAADSDAAVDAIAYQGMITDSNHVNYQTDNSVIIETDSNISVNADTASNTNFDHPDQA